MTPISLLDWGNLQDKIISIPDIYVCFLREFSFMDVNSTLIITCSQSYFRYKTFPQQTFVIFVGILSGYSFAMS